MKCDSYLASHPAEGLIKNTLKIYNTGSQFVLFILAYSKMFRLFPLEFFKHQIHRILEILVILPSLHAVDHLDQRGEILLALQGFIVNVSDKRCIQQRLGFDPEILAAFAFSLGIGD